MKSTISSAVLVLSVAATAFAATAYGPAETQPDRPGECWDQATNLFFKPGDSWTQEGCMEASCLELNATGIPKLFVTYQTCGKMAVEAPCYLVEDKSQSYPDCCPEIVCPDSAEEEQNVGSSTKPEEEAQVKQTPTTQMVDVAGRTISTSQVVGVSVTSTTSVPAPATSEEPTKDSRSDFDEFNNWDHDSHFRDDSDNEVPSSGSSSGGDSYRLFDIFRKTFAWDDYSYNDVMDNNVDDAPYGNSPDYYHYGKQLSTGFSQDDFDIKRFKWF